MWVKQNDNTSCTIVSGFWAVIGGVVTLVDADYDKRKKPHGFAWESDVDILNGYLQHNADLITAELAAMEAENVNNGV